MWKALTEDREVACGFVGGDRGVSWMPLGAVINEAGRTAFRLVAIKAFASASKPG